MNRWRYGLCERIARYESKQWPYLFISTRVPDARYLHEKYFIKYHNTYGVFKAFKTQRELSDYLESEGY